MLALTVRQPWAYLLLNALKMIEIRTWRPKDDSFWFVLHVCLNKSWRSKGSVLLNEMKLVREGKDEMIQQEGCAIALLHVCNIEETATLDQTGLTEYDRKAYEIAFPQQFTAFQNSCKPEKAVYQWNIDKIIPFATRFRVPSGPPQHQKLWKVNADLVAVVEKLLAKDMSDTEACLATGNKKKCVSPKSNNAFKAKN